MLKNLAADAFGLSDLGKIIGKDEYGSTDIDEYVFHEDDEKIYVLVRSKADEYCFTNTAFMHLNGESARSKKKVLTRYPYKHYPISDVMVETAGTIDLDAEIKFSVGNQSFSIDIDKKQIDQIRAVYKALFSVSEECINIQNNLNILQSSHDAVNRMFTIRELPEQVILSLPDIINQTCQQLENHFNVRKNEIQDYDFGSIFERFIVK